MAIARLRVTGGGNRTRLMGCFDQFFIMQGGAYESTPRVVSRVDVTDQEKWRQAVATVTHEYTALGPGLLARVAKCAEAVKSRKAGLHALTGMAGGRETCAGCGGECCLTGKYHFTVVDLLVYLAEGRGLFTPRFDNGRCPYLGDAGCLMEAAYRPFNCITFNCDRVEGMLEPLEQARFYTLERELRALYRELEMLFGNRFIEGLLMNYERALRQRGAILKTAEDADGRYTRPGSGAYR